MWIAVPTQKAALIDEVAVINFQNCTMRSSGLRREHDEEEI